MMKSNGEELAHHVIERMQVGGSLSGNVISTKTDVIMILDNNVLHCMEENMQEICWFLSFPELSVPARHQFPSSNPYTPKSRIIWPSLRHFAAVRCVDRRAVGDQAALGGAHDFLLVIHHQN
jgi:hypothetical protein